MDGMGMKRKVECELWMAIDLVNRQFGPRQYAPVMDSQPIINILGPVSERMKYQAVFA